MKPTFQPLKTALISFFSFLALLAYSSGAVAQLPRGVPDPDNAEPISFNDPATIITFIVLPLLFIVLYLWLKRRKRKE